MSYLSQQRNLYVRHNKLVWKDDAWEGGFIYPNAIHVTATGNEITTAVAIFFWSKLDCQFGDSISFNQLKLSQTSTKVPRIIVIKFIIYISTWII